MVRTSRTYRAYVPCIRTARTYHAYVPCVHTMRVCWLVAWSVLSEWGVGLCCQVLIASAADSALLMLTAFCAASNKWKQIVQGMVALRYTPSERRLCITNPDKWAKSFKQLQDRMLKEYDLEVPCGRPCDWTTRRIAIAWMLMSV